MSHLSYAQRLHPLTSLISANKKSPILLEFRGTGQGDVPLPREVRGDNDMDTGDAFALLREKIQ